MKISFDKVIEIEDDEGKTRGYCTKHKKKNLRKRDVVKLQHTISEHWEREKESKKKKTTTDSKWKMPWNLCSIRLVSGNMLYGFLVKCVILGFCFSLSFLRLLFPHSRENRFYWFHIIYTISKSKWKLSMWSHPVVISSLWMGIKLSSLSFFLSISMYESWVELNSYNVSINGKSCTILNCTKWANWKLDTSTTIATDLYFVIVI